MKLATLPRHARRERADPANRSRHMVGWWKLDRRYDGIDGFDHSMHGNHLLGNVVDYRNGGAYFDGTVMLTDHAAGRPRAWASEPLVLDEYTSSGTLTTASGTVTDSAAAIPIGTNNEKWGLASLFQLTGMPTAGNNQILLATHHSTAPTANVLTLASGSTPNSNETSVAGNAKLQRIVTFVNLLMWEHKVPSGATATQYGILGSLDAAGLGWLVRLTQSSQTIEDRFKGANQSANFNTFAGLAGAFDDTWHRFVIAHNPAHNAGNALRMVSNLLRDYNATVLGYSLATAQARALWQQANDSAVGLCIGGSNVGAPTARMVGGIRNVQLYRVPIVTWTADGLYTTTGTTAPRMMDLLMRNGILTRDDLGA